MLLDAIALAILALFAGLGAWRGAVAAACSFASLVIGYAVSIWASQVLGAPAAAYLGTSELIAAPLVGTILFAASIAITSLFGRWARRWDRERLGESPRSGRDRMLGGVFGSLRGALVVVLLGWLALWADAARDLTGGARFASVPETRESLVAGASSEIVEGVVHASLGGGQVAGARVAARLAAHPGESIDAMRKLVSDPRLKAVQADRLFWTYVESGSVESALNQASFWGVVNDSELRGELADLGLISREASEDPRIFRQAMAEVIRQVGPRLKQLREDPELQRLANDPEIVGMLEAGDTIGLASNPRIQQIVARVSEGL